LLLDNVGLAVSFLETFLFVFLVDSKYTDSKLTFLLFGLYTFFLAIIREYPLCKTNLDQDKRYQFYHLTDNTQGIN
jgi:hypothetical protein